MNRVVSISALLLVFGMTNPAAAEFCDEIQSILRHADNRFASIRGNARGSSHDSTFKLPGASRCWIRSQKGAYWCSWKVDSRSQLKAELERFASAISRCLPGSEYDDSDLKDSSGSEPALWIEYRSYRFYVTIDDDDGTIDLSLDKRER